MSYILDALRKSDQQRQRGSTPTLHTAHFPGDAPPRRRPWFYATLAAALAAAAFTLGWLRPWHTEPSAAVAETPAAEPPVTEAGDTRIATRSIVGQPAEPASQQTPEFSAQPASRKPRADEHIDNSAAAARPSPRPAERTRASAPATAEAARRPSIALANRAAAPDPAASAVASPNGAASPDTARTRTRTGVPDTGASAAPAPPAPEDKPLSWTELPPEMRKEIPPLTVTVHAFSQTPKDRLVGVNDRLLREGEALGDDLVLERITPDGMIFSYKGTRFHRGVQ
jgi:general secretion pathway protein B